MRIVRLEAEGTPPPNGRRWNYLTAKLGTHLTPECTWRHFGTVLGLNASRIRRQPALSFEKKI